jgi:hypothetical protein
MMTEHRGENVEIPRRLLDAAIALRESIPAHWHGRRESEFDEALDGWRAAETCTGLTASWCPIHGDCTCPRHGDAANPDTSEGMRGEVINGQMEDPSCPLHAPSSGHSGSRADLPK